MKWLYENWQWCMTQHNNANLQNANECKSMKQEHKKYATQNSRCIDPQELKPKHGLSKGNQLILWRSSNKNFWINQILRVKYLLLSCLTYYLVLFWSPCFMWPETVVWAFQSRLQTPTNSLPNRSCLPQTTHLDASSNYSRKAQITV